MCVAKSRESESEDKKKAWLSVSAILYPVSVFTGSNAHASTLMVKTMWKEHYSTHLCRKNNDMCDCRNICAPLTAVWGLVVSFRLV